METIKVYWVPFLMGVLVSATLFMGTQLYGNAVLSTVVLKPKPSCDCCCGGSCTCTVGECSCGGKCKCPPCKRCREFNTGSLTGN